MKKWKKINQYNVSDLPEWAQDYIEELHNKAHSEIKNCKKCGGIYSKGYKRIFIARYVYHGGVTWSIQAIKCPEVYPPMEELNKFCRGDKHIPPKWAQMIRRQPIIIHGFIGAEGRWKHYDGGFRARRFYNNHPHFLNRFTYIEFAPEALKRSRKQRRSARRRDPFNSQKVHKLMKQMFMWAAEEDNRFKDIIDNMRFVKTNKKKMINAIISAHEMNEGLGSHAPDSVYETIRDLLNGVEERPTDKYAGKLYDFICDMRGRE